MPDITIYTTMLCPYCHMAKQLLQQKGAAFREVDISGKPWLRDELRAKAGGRGTVPQIWIGAIHVGGCDDLYRLERGGGLDPLLAA